ncbi:MAG: protein phosphatase 2C domain-containing protein [Candidatus Binataceae bacterium]
MNPPPSEAMGAPAFDLAALSDIGNERANNEDSCGHFVESGTSVLFVVADGVGGYEGGEIASAMAVELTLGTYRDSPAVWGPAKRLQRAVQRANIEIHNRAMVVPELRRMASTLTAVVIDDGVLYGAHVGDCRLYLIRGGRIRQLTKDHTVVAERVRMGLMSAARARSHPERSALSRSLGHELIVSIDRLSMPLLADDRLLLCSDGLYNVLEERELQRMADGPEAEEVCRRLIARANQRGTHDNLTAAVCIIGHLERSAQTRLQGSALFRLVCAASVPLTRAGWFGRVSAIFARSR